MLLNICFKGIVIAHKDCFYMKKSSNGNIVLTFATSIFALISICVLFANAFSDATWGTGFEVIFGLESKNTAFCLGLFIAFLCGCLAVFLPFVSFFTKGKARVGLFLFLAVLSIASATLMLFGKQFFLSSNTFDHSNETSLDGTFAIGTALIANAVFMYLAGATSLLGAYTNRPSKEEE